MLNGGDKNLLCRCELAGKMMHHHVVRLGRAAGPDDVQGIAAEETGEFFAGIGQGDGGLGAVLVHGRWIAAELFSDMQPRFTRLAHDGGGGVVIKVNHRKMIRKSAMHARFYSPTAVVAARRILPWALVNARAR